LEGELSYFKAGRARGESLVLSLRTEDGVEHLATVTVAATGVNGGKVQLEVHAEQDVEIMKVPGL
jgi:hypothetical protein